MGLGPQLRLDMGLVRVLGLGALSLRPLDRLGRPMVLVAGLCDAVLLPDLGSGLRFVLRFRLGLPSFRLGVRLGLRFVRLVPAWSH